MNNNTYRILLYTHDGLGANFFGGNAADNLYKNDGARKKLEEYEELLTRFNSWVDAVVEKKNGYYFIKDTKIIYWGVKKRGDLFDVWVSYSVKWIYKFFKKLN